MVKWTSTLELYSNYYQVTSTTQQHFSALASGKQNKVSQRHQPLSQMNEYA